MILRNREVIFLHWFHHATVLLYCWHAFHNSIAPGIWFAAMNYVVHSIMYLYYFLAATGYRKVGVVFCVGPALLLRDVEGY